MFIFSVSHSLIWVLQYYLCRYIQKFVINRPRKKAEKKILIWDWANSEELAAFLQCSAFLEILPYDRVLVNKFCFTSKQLKLLWCFDIYISYNWGSFRNIQGIVCPKSYTYGKFVAYTVYRIFTMFVRIN